MGGIFDDPQAVLFRKRIHAVQIDRVARVVHRHDGLGAGGKAPFRIGEIDGRRIKARIAGHRDGPGPADSLKGRHERQRRHQHFRAAPVPEHSLDSQVQGGCPGIGGNDPTRGHAQISRHISLKLLHFLADAQVAVFADDAAHGLGFGLANDGTGKSHAHVSLRGFPPCPAVRRAHRSAPCGGRQKKGQENPALTCYQ